MFHVEQSKISLHLLNSKLYCSKCSTWNIYYNFYKGGLEL
nr:MAG TPA: hypothetical protein [Caudoviricetes sp.]